MAENFTVEQKEGHYYSTGTHLHMICREIGKQKPHAHRVLSCTVPDLEIIDRKAKPDPMPKPSWCCIPSG
jgi:hypothetical protein